MEIGMEYDQRSSDPTTGSGIEKYQGKLGDRETQNEEGWESRI